MSYALKRCADCDTILDEDNVGEKDYDRCVICEELKRDEAARPRD